MTSQDQARADATAEEQTVDDPLDTSNVPDTGATELAEYNEFVDSLEEGEGEESPAPEEERTEEEAETTEEESEEQGDEPADEEETTEEAENTASGEEEDSEEEEGEPANRSGRYRIRAKDEVEAEALSLRKRHPEWSLDQCLSKAKAILGVDETKSNETEGGEKAPSRTVDAVARELDELRQKHKEATDNLEFSEASDIFLQIEKLRDERDELRISERYEKEKQEQDQYQSMERQFRDSERKAVTYYPETTDPDSSMTKRIIELDQQMRDLDDPLFSSPDKPFILAKLAAKELGIPMTNPKATPAKAKTATASRPVNPASGNARTNPRPSSPKMNDALAGVDTVEAYEDLVASL